MLYFELQDRDRFAGIINCITTNNMAINDVETVDGGILLYSEHLQQSVIISSLTNQAKAKSQEIYHISHFEYGNMNPMRIHMSTKQRIFKVHQIPKKQCINSAVYFANTGIVCRIIWAILEWQKMQRNILQQQSWEHCEFCRFRRSQKRIMSSCFLKCSKSEDNEATISRWLFKRDVTKNKRRHCRAKYDAITNNNFCENIKDRPKSRPGTRKRWHQHHEDAFLYDLFEVIFFVISHG